MQRIFVDFGRGIGDDVDILTTAEPNRGVQLCEGETVILYDSSLEVQATLHQDARPSDGQVRWVARPVWSTQRDLV